MRIALLLALSTLSLAACGDSGGQSLSGRLVLVRADGLVERDLSDGNESVLVATPSGALLIEPSISPDGSKLAYVRQLVPIVVPGGEIELGMDLYLANSDGTDARLLLEHERSNDQLRAPTWLPDGERLLINVQRLENNRITSELELLDISTGERTVVQQDAFRPAVSPDGQRIVYVRQDENFLQSLWIANLDGSGEQLLAGPNDGLGTFNSPRFSPDGATIAFGAAPPLEQFVRAEAGTELVSREAVRSGATAYNGLPEDIWVVGADGSGLRRLVELQIDLPSIAWSADGTQIFVLGGTGLYVIDPVDGSERLLGEGTFHGQLDWLAAE
ncbi:MAG: hypothetical protein WD939_01410 [Dehalococcoidia bacterium]